jgi:hypothetical protein
VLSVIQTISTTHNEGRKEGRKGKERNASSDSRRRRWRQTVSCSFSRLLLVAVLRSTCVLIFVESGLPHGSRAFPETKPGAAGVHGVVCDARCDADPRRAADSHSVRRVRGNDDDDDDDGALRPRPRRERLSLSSSDAASKVLSKLLLPGLADVTASEDDGDQALPPARVEMQLIVGSTYIIMMIINSSSNNNSNNSNSSNNSGSNNAVGVVVLGSCAASEAFQYTFRSFSSSDMSSDMCICCRRIEPSVTTTTTTTARTGGSACSGSSTQPTNERTNDDAAAATAHTTNDDNASDHTDVLKTLGRPSGGIRSDPIRNRRVTARDPCQPAEDEVRGRRRVRVQARRRRGRRRRARSHTGRRRRGGSLATFAAAGGLALPGKPFDRPPTHDPTYDEGEAPSRANLVNGNGGPKGARADGPARCANRGRHGCSRNSNRQERAVRSERAAVGTASPSPAQVRGRCRPLASTNGRRDARRRPAEVAV